MAQYYRPRGEQSPLQPEPAAVSQSAAAAEPVLDDLELGGIYIFPSPSSAPHSPSQYSDISAPTDFSYSGLSEPRSRDVSPNGRSPSVPWDHVDGTLSLTTTPDAFVDGDADCEGSMWHMVSPDSVLAQRQHWELVLQQRASRHRLRLATEGPEPSGLHHHRSQRSQSPHPRIHIPLLSYLVSLFALDDETLHLLQHSSPQSVLFPGTRSEAIVAGDDENLFDMRVTKLLHAVDSDKAYHSLKEGLAISYQTLPNSATHTFPLTRFIPFISKLITNGGKALYEVFQNHQTLTSFDLQRFHNVVKTTRDRLRASPPLSKLSSAKRTTVALDLVLVAASIRTGYLVDAISTQDPSNTYTSLLHLLWQIHPIFDSLLIIHEPRSEQTFFVHTRLVHRRLKQMLATVTDLPNTPDPSDPSAEAGYFLDVTFVSSGPEPPTTRAMPGDLHQVLEHLTAELDARISGSSDHQPVIHLPESHPSAMIPLAAILLEYPVAYVPSPDPTSLTFLSGISLDVYEVVLTSSELQQHTLLKFSCPHGLTEGLSPDVLKERVNNHFMSRLITTLLGMTLVVSHREQTFDRVAL